MGVKKVKISSVKRAQHLKSKKKFTKPQTKKVAEPSTTGHKKTQNIFLNKSKRKEKPNKKQKQRHIENFDDEDDDENKEEVVDNIMDIIDPDDLELLELSQRKSKKRKREEGAGGLDNDDDDDDDGEAAAKKFEKEHTNKTIKEKNENKLTINLLPIKSKDGEIITRTTKVDYKPKITSDDTKENVDIDNDNDDEQEVEYEDSDDDIIKDDDDDDKNLPKKVVSTADLLILREQEIEKQKYRIGIICSGILEKPEDKVKNFKALFNLMDECNENGSTNLLTVRKIAMMSITEVFKDILPEYRVGQVDTKMAVGMYIRK